MSTVAQKSPVENFKVCSACHTIGKGKLVGPDLKGVTQRHDEAWLIKFIRSSQTMVKEGDKVAVKLFNDNNKIPMPDNPLTDDEIKALLKYIENPEAFKSEETVVKADPNFLENEESSLPKSTTGLFYISIAILLFSIFDLGVTRFLGNAVFVHVLLISASVFLIFMTIYTEAVNLGRTPGYEPDQPIKFSHRVHSGENKIDCKYCHSDVLTGKNAGIPSSNVCLNCHTVIKKGTNTGETEIAKIYKAVQEGKSVEWIKVSNLPDHVFFSHAQHVNAGKLECAECHGKVEEMGRLQQATDMSMGWCLNCHRTKFVNMDNKYYSNQFEKFHEELKNKSRKGVTVSEIGGQDCAKCHY
ncbi:MAG: c-type cytochrome [Bacteroidales bacterium]